MTNSTKSIGTTGAYSVACADVTNAVSGELSTDNKWQKAGFSTRAHFGTEAALLEIKAQFIADAILPGMDKKHAKALQIENVRKGSSEYNALDSAGRDAWEALNKAKKDARAMAHTFFARVVKYAFPTEKAETAPRTLETRMAEELAALIKACEKAEAPAFDVALCLTHLKAALSVVTK